MGVQCEGVEGATAKPPRRVRRRETLCATKESSRFSLQNQMKSSEINNKMFAALFVICFIFTIVTKALNLIKQRVLRWQIGVVK